MARQAVHVVNGTIDTITEVANVTSVDTVDTVTAVTTVASVTEVQPNDSTGTQAAPVAMSQTVATIIAAASNTRKYLLLQNIGAQDVYISFDGGDPVATSDGFLLTANGGSYEAKAPGHVPQGIVEGICASGLTSTVMVYDVDEA